MVIRGRTIGTDQVQILKRNLARTSIVIQNTHATANIYISDASQVTTTTGMRVQAGASISLKIPEDDPSEDYWCISDTATTTIVIYEGFGRPELS